MAVAICRLYQSSLQKELCIKIEKMFKLKILKYWTFFFTKQWLWAKIKIMSKIIKYRLNGSLTTQPPGFNLRVSVNFIVIHLK